VIGFQAPLWLLLLGLVPLIRWLHRFRTQSSILPSTTLFLWSGLQRSSIDDGNPDKPDPRWILRALICSLLVLALARPQLQTTEPPPLEVWIDDSLSMFTLEQGQSRIQAGLQQLYAYLGEHEFSAIRLHSLGDPGAVLSLEPADNASWGTRLGNWIAGPRAEPMPPPLVSLSQQGIHILITDGADDNLNRWAGSAALTRIIRSGELRQNLALGRMSLRNSLNDSAGIAGSARIDNLGDAAASVRLVIEHQADVVETREYEIPPLGNSMGTFSLTDGSTGVVEARLESNDDPLPFDDSLRLDIAGLAPAVAYSIIGDCDPGLMTVIESQPALVNANERADVRIDCGAGAQDSTLPTLVLHPVSNPRRSTQSAHWHSELSTGYLPIAAGLAYSDAAPALSSANKAILSANGRMLISSRPGAGKIIDCYLDIGDAAFTRQAQYPLLIIGLLSHLGGRSLETLPLGTSRDPRASLITPTAIPPGTSANTVRQRVEVSYTSPILLAVLLLLLADAALFLLATPGRANWQA